MNYIILLLMLCGYRRMDHENIHYQIKNNKQHHFLS